MQSPRRKRESPARASTGAYSVEPELAPQETIDKGNAVHAA